MNNNEELFKLSILYANYFQCDGCSSNYKCKCIRKDNNSETIGVCWMERGQGEY